MPTPDPAHSGGTTVFARRASRHSALGRPALLDTPAAQSVDRIAYPATRNLDVPIAPVSLVDVNRRSVKRSIGLPEPYSSRRAGGHRQRACGLGPSFAIGIVTAYGGTIRAKHRGSGGARFSMSLPATDD